MSEFVKGKEKSELSPTFKSRNNRKSFGGKKRQKEEELNVYQHT